MTTRRSHKKAGMTERIYESFDRGPWTGADRELFGAMVAPGGGLIETLNAWYSNAVAIASAANLPTDARPTALHDDGLGGKCILRGLVRDRLGSPEWYAVETLSQIEELKSALERGRLEPQQLLLALTHALNLGSLFKEIETKAVWEKHAMRGQKVGTGQSAGGKERAQSFAKVHALYRNEYAKLDEKQSKQRRYELVAQRVKSIVAQRFPDTRVSVTAGAVKKILTRRK